MPAWSLAAVMSANLCRSTILKRLSSASVTSANDFLERIVMSLHVNSVSATCDSNLAPFIRTRGISVGLSSHVRYELMRIGPRGCPSRRGGCAQPDADRHYSCGT